MARHKNAHWKLNDPIRATEEAQVAVLMDIRDELQAQNAQMKRLLAVLECPNFVSVPRKLERIAQNAVKIAGRLGQGEEQGE